MDSKIAAKLGRKLAKLSRENQFSGAVLIRQGEVDLFQRAYGYANRSWGIKNSIQTRFRIASVGKLFTAAAIMQLIEAKTLSLETRIVETLGLQGTKIPPDATVYHMLTMTSGIADWIDEDAADYEAEWAAFCRDHPIYLFRGDADYLPIFSQLEPYHKLNEKHRYNGAGFMLLGLMIEKLSGLSYFDYVRVNIFSRAGMAATEFLGLDDVSPNVAEGYIPVEDEHKIVVGWKRNIYATTAGPAADGGATSTTGDLVLFSRALRNGRLLSPESVQLMLSPKVVENDDGYAGYQWMYGFGCFIVLNAEGKIVRWGHTGEEDGVSCRLFYYPEQDMDVIILGNQSWCAGKISWEIHELIVQ